MKQAAQRMLIAGSLFLLAAGPFVAAAGPASLLATGTSLAQPSNSQAQQSFDQAREAHAEGDAQKAIDLYRRAIEADPQFVEACLKLGVLLYQRERYPGALSTLQAPTGEAPTLAPAFCWLGLVNIRIAQGFTSPDVRRRYLLDARRALERYLELAPGGEFAAEARRLLVTLPSP